MPKTIKGNLKEERIKNKADEEANKYSWGKLQSTQWTYKLENLPGKVLQLLSKHWFGFFMIKPASTDIFLISQILVVWFKLT